MAHSANTLKYAAPLRVAVQSLSKASKAKLELDVRDPALWSHDQIAAWVRNTAAAAVVNGTGAEGAEAAILDGDAFTAGMSGVQVCALPEIEFHRRTVAALTTTEPGSGMLPVDVKALAKAIYTSLWTLIVDAKTRRRHGRRRSGARRELREWFLRPRQGLALIDSHASHWIEAHYRQPRTQ